jgi:Bacterial membrane protein YfhO
MNRQFVIALALMLLLVAIVFAETVARGWTPAAPALVLQTFPWAAYSFGAPPAMNPMQVDIAFQFHPWLDYIRSQLAAGHIPLWNPRSGAGEPLLALGQPAILSPLTWIAVLAPMPHALVVLAALQLLVGGAGMFVLLRSFGLGWGAALFGGVAWLLNSFSVGWLYYPFASVAAWTPWLVWSVSDAARAPTMRAVARVAIFGALTLVAGQPEVAFKVWLLAGAVAVVAIWKQSVNRRRASIRLVAAAVLAVALAAPQVLPFLAHLPNTGKLASRQAQSVNDTYTPRKTVVTAVVPDFFGPAAGPWVGVTNRHGAPTNYLEQTIFPGVTTWVLAAVGLAAASGHWAVRTLAGAGALAALLKYGAPGLLWLASTLPLFSITVLGRFNVVVLFAASALAGWGVDAFSVNAKRKTLNAKCKTPNAKRIARDAQFTFPESQRPTANGQWLTSSPAIAAAVAFLAMALLVGASLVRERDLLQAAGLWQATQVKSVIALSIAAAIAACVLARARQWISPIAATVIVTFVVSAELVIFARTYHPLAPASLSYPPVPELQAIARDPDLFRVIGVGKSLLPNAHLPTGLASAMTYDGVDGNRRLNALLERGLRIDPRRPVEPQLTPPAAADSTLLDLLNVKYVIAPPGTSLPLDRFTPVQVGRGTVYRNLRAFPRAFLVNGVHLADGPFAVDLVACASAPDDSEEQTAVRPAQAGLKACLHSGGPESSLHLGGPLSQRVDLRRSVVLPAELAPADRPQPGPTEHDRAHVTDYRPHTIEVTTESPGRRVLVMTDPFDEGWQATVDGRRVDVLRANVAFRAVAVPAGQHVVRFHYRPLPFYAGLALAALAALVLVALCYLNGGEAGARSKAFGV